MDYDKLVELRNVGFTKEIGLKVVEIREEYAKAELNLTAMHGNPIGTVHGGVLFSIAEEIAGTAACSRGRNVTTVSATISYLSPAIVGEKLIAEAKEIKAGRRIGTYESVIRNEKGKKIAFLTLTFFYLNEIIFQ